MKFHHFSATEAFYSRNYAVQAGPNGPVKIGLTTNIQSRVQTLQQACPFELVLIADWSATVADERRIHRLLTPYRLRREWYHPVQPVFELVEREKAAAEAREPSRLAYVERVTANASRMGSEREAA